MKEIEAALAWLRLQKKLIDDAIAALERLPSRLRKERENDGRLDPEGRP